jgi:hypothetical protein
MDHKALLTKYAEAGRRHVPKRLQSDSKYLDELRSLLGLHGQNWTSRFGRAFQYEFFLREGIPDQSLLVEISSVAPVAFVYFGYRDSGAGCQTIDKCSDLPRDQEHSAYREMVVEFLEKREFTVLPYELKSLLLGCKTAGELLIFDPED